MLVNMRQLLNEIDNKTLYLNLAFTQLILLIIGLVLYYFFLWKNVPLPTLFHIENLQRSLLIGFLFALLVLSLNLLLLKLFPSSYFDDGGINERLFRDVHVGHIFLIALGVSLVEEWLFRAVLQNIIGWLWASLLFALIHVRYLRHWFYALLILLISFGFGGLYHFTGSFWSVVTAHFTIDFSVGLLLRYKLYPFSSK